MEHSDSCSLDPVFIDYLLYYFLELLEYLVLCFCFEANHILIEFIKSLEKAVSHFLRHLITSCSGFHRSDCDSVFEILFLFDVDLSSVHTLDLIYWTEQLWVSLEPCCACALRQRIGVVSRSFSERVNEVHTPAATSIAWLIITYVYYHYFLIWLP